MNIESFIRTLKQETDCDIVPVPLAELAKRERELGFQLPEILRQLYLRVGDGGFGPGYGIFGLDKAANWYLSELQHAADKENAVWNPGNKQWFWLKQMLPLCEWGCGIRSCVLCSVPGAPIIRQDTNLDLEDIQNSIEAHHLYPNFEHFDYACWVEASSIEAWFEAWFAGKDLFQIGKPKELRPEHRQQEPYL